MASPPDQFDVKFGQEAAELMGFARSLGARSEELTNLFESLVSVMTERFERVANDAELEQAAEDSGRALRQLWLEACAASASRTYRSPPAAQRIKTPTGRRIEFGYERDLQPTYLEALCGRFFDQLPPGWSSDHVLLSSGQSAMAAALHALEGSLLFDSDRKLSFAHLGSYFETADIFSLFSSLMKPAGRGRDAVKHMTGIEADIFIIEPVFCDGEFGSVNASRLIEHHRRLGDRKRVYIFDNTLLGTTFSVENQLRDMFALRLPAVFRLCSGLKLFQGGLELSNVGILSVFTPENASISARQFGERIRKIRTLLGLGLSFAEVAALEAPWFLNRDYTNAYQRAVFENNAALARTVADHNRLFRGISHPSLLRNGQGPNAAPFCVFRLAQSDSQAYDRLEQHVTLEARRRGVLLEHGGSFGFRGHRFEVVRPEGSEPFLRVALGRRSGWSCEQVIQLMSEIAQTQSVEHLGTAAASARSPIRKAAVNTELRRSV